MSTVGNTAWSGFRRNDGIARATICSGVLLLMHFSSALQCIVNARADIFGAHVTLELRLLHQLSGLLPCPAEKEGSAGCMKLIGEVLNRSESGSIDGSHVSQS